MVNNTAVAENNSTSSPGAPYNISAYSTANATVTAPAPRLSESSPYQATHNNSSANGRTNSVNGGNSNNNADLPFTNSSSSVNMRRTSHSPQPQAQAPVPPPPTLPRLQSPSTTATSVTPNYSRQRTPVAEQSPSSVVPVNSSNTIGRNPGSSPTAHPPPPPTINTASAAASQAANSNGYRPLNVKDALTYLDQVKVKFADQPEVYNRFLDIMKEFKSQA
jgi:paired amphipathic helix protein Sin3a